LGKYLLDTDATNPSRMSAGVRPTPSSRLLLRNTAQVFFVATLLVSWLKGAPAGATAAQTRGVRPDQQALYVPDQALSCKSSVDGNTISLPHSRINDDFCDCADGKDEPGTAACSYISPQTGFYCQNVGHVGHNIPSSRVNDGLCDCCDGSDENSVVVSGRASVVTVCNNTCVEVAKESQKDLRGSLKRRMLGHKKRQEYGEQGQKAIAEAKAQVQ
jgi:protein kinase C substrate 80K-H